jgi:hypothetical protein
MVEVLTDRNNLCCWIFIGLVLDIHRRPTRENTMPKKNSGHRKYGKSAGKAVRSAMHRKKKGTLKSGKGGKVKSRKQAIAIGLSEARKKGAKVPKKKS